MFANRRSAGRQLAAWLEQLREEKPVVLALPRGGVPVGFEIAEGLDAALDIVLVRKIGVPWQPELALGAVDDGIATGSTVRTALRAIGRTGAGKIVLAVPVAPEDALEELRKEVDEIICLSTPSPFLAVGAHYAEFGQLADADVISLLEKRHRRMARSGDRPGG